MRQRSRFVLALSPAVHRAQVQRIVLIQQLSAPIHLDAYARPLSDSNPTPGGAIPPLHHSFSSAGQVDDVGSPFDQGQGLIDGSSPVGESPRIGPNADPLAPHCPEVGQHSSNDVRISSASNQTAHPPARRVRHARSADSCNAGPSDQRQHESTTIGKGVQAACVDVRSHLA
jgi:hypothetical protein